MPGKYPIDKIRNIGIISEKEKEAVKDFRKKLSDKLGDEIVSVQLFGSKARGDFHKNSDIDILVTLRNPTEDQINFIYDTAIFSNYECGAYLSVKIFSQEEFEYYKSIPTLFIQNLLKERIII